jgi:hypothetical protein
MQQFTTAATLAAMLHVERRHVDRDCQAGDIPGAFFDRVTWQWWVPRGAFSALASALTRSGVCE